ncbi:hypothetical protein Mapa_003009 [Marchantia paleacea]|nr:hypothetical protein Mapa_003009 [Marchantia paleacea]
MMSNMSINHRRHDAESPQVPEAYSPKPSKPWTSVRPIDYLLKEQRLVFILLGMGIASCYFMLQPESMFAAEQRHTYAMMDTMGSGHRINLETPTFPVVKQHPFIGSSGGKIPLGLKRKPLRVVVTGGAGFVGSHLVDRLMDRGDSVIVVDNFFTGRKENLQRHFGDPRFELIRHDVVEPILLEVDQIYHLACPASPVHYKHNPVKTIISFCKS